MIQKEDCLFCKIVKGEIPSKKIYENDKVYAFEDISPMAPIHWLFIHKNHSHDIVEMIDQDVEQVGDLFKAMKEAIVEHNFSKSGLRIVNNRGEDGGQTVFHTHFHLLAGKKLRGFA